jgi:hypothetical protein
MDQRGIWLVVLLAFLAFLAFLAVRLPLAQDKTPVHGKSEASEKKKQRGKEHKEQGSSTIEGSRQEAKEDKQQGAIKDDGKDDAQEEKPKANDVKEGLQQRLKDAVFLVQVEKAKHFWPVATCCAISGNTLLTSAREAAKLAEYRSNGFDIWATNPAGNQKMAVQDVRTHVFYLKLADKPGDWIYFDVGLLTVEGNLPKVAELASTKELAEVKVARSVFCFGFSHDGHVLSESENLQPEVIRSKVLRISAPSDLPSPSCTLHLTGNFPENLHGSPIVNDQGKIVAVYGEAADDPEMKMKIHYAPVLNRELIDEWLQHRNAKIWVSPDNSKSNSALRDGK